MADHIDNQYIECKNCGARGLHWVEFRNTWLLFNGENERHICPNPHKKTAQDRASTK